VGFPRFRIGNPHLCVLDVTIYCAPITGASLGERFHCSHGTVGAAMISGNTCGLFSHAARVIVLVYFENKRPSMCAFIIDNG
jgi:hypothetical protein